MSPLKHKRTFWAAGFMSGTSLDGVDAAMIQTNGTEILAMGPAIAREYAPEDRAILQAATDAARAWRWSSQTPNGLAQAEDVLHRTHSALLKALIADAGFAPDLIGVHGQTLLHAAPSSGQKGRTLQAFDAQRFFRTQQIPLVYDFRSADMRAGGHGAPLAPAYHGALAKSAGLKNALIVNLGGVANLTWCDGSESLIAYDTGPANGPVDTWVARHQAGLYDKGGALAARGKIDETKITAWLTHPFFDRAPPKSLDRYDFSAELAEGMSLEDGAATLTTFCAASLAHSLKHLPAKPEIAIICGGGRHNPALIRALETHLPFPVKTAEHLGWRGDFIEAEAFALLAVRHVMGLPLSWPLTTGITAPICGGEMLGMLKV